MNVIKASKKEFRKQIKQRLSLMTPENKLIQSEIVKKKLFALSEYQNSKRLSIFLSMADEVQTTDILKDALASNKCVFIPRYKSGTNFMDMVRLYSWSEFEALPVTKWNIKQPPLDEKRETALSSGGLDLILMPGLAFTVSGKRLGRGAGYYDTYLALVAQQQGKLPATVALTFKEQIVPDLPTDETDVIISKILTAD